MLILSKLWCDKCLYMNVVVNKSGIIEQLEILSWYEAKIYIRIENPGGQSIVKMLSTVSSIPFELNSSYYTTVTGNNGLDALSGMHQFNFIFCIIEQSMILK